MYLRHKVIIDALIKYHYKESIPFTSDEKISVVKTPCKECYGDVTVVSYKESEELLNVPGNKSIMLQTDWHSKH